MLNSETYDCWVSDKGHVVTSNCRHLDEGVLPDAWYENDKILLFPKSYKGFKWKMGKYAEAFEEILKSIDCLNHTKGPKLPILFSKTYADIHQANGGIIGTGGLVIKA